MGGYSNGVWTRYYNWTNDANAAINIRADRMDTEDNGFATGLSTCILKDGTQTVTANIPFANFKLTAVGSGTVRTDGANLSNIQDGQLVWAGTATGTASAIAIGTTPATTSLLSGRRLRFKASANSSGVVTIAENGLTAKKLLLPDAVTQATTGNIVINAIYEVTYDAAADSAAGAYILNGTGNPAVVASQLPALTGDVTTVAGAVATTVAAVGGWQVAGFRNWVHNGGFNIWQRGTTYALTTSIAYGSADRFAFDMPSTAAGIANQNTSVPSAQGFQYSLKIGRTAASALTNAISLYQAMETANSVMLAGIPVTLSFWAKAGANFSASSNNINASIYTGTGTDQSCASMLSWTGSAHPINATQAITTSWVRYQFTATLSSSATQIGVKIGYTPSGTAGADDNLFITGIQLEPGSIATPFEFRPFQIERKLCLPYYQKSFAYTTAPAQNVGTSTGETFFPMQKAGATINFIHVWLEERMRIAPTLTYYNPAASNAQARDETGAADGSITGTAAVGERFVEVSYTGNAGSTVNNAYAVHWSATADL